jgi:hypothetical protein
VRTAKRDTGLSSIIGLSRKGNKMKLNIRVATCEWMRRLSLILSVGLFIFFWASFADFGGARNGLRFKDISQGGYATWIFIIIGAIIVLLQLIPAIILLFSFIGTGTHIGYKVIPDKEEIEDESIEDGA